MPTTKAWRKRDALIGAALFLLTAAFTLWQNTRVAVLWDLSFLLDSSYRFSLGQLPYKTLPFPHPPLTFLLHAAIIRIFGRVYLPHILCAAIEAGAATVLTWCILLRIFRSSSEARHSGTARISVFASGTQPFALLLAAPLTVLGIYAIYPHPIYDSDTILVALLALYLLQRPATSAAANFLAGAVCVLPLFFKQNIGLIFLIIVLASVATIAVFRRLQCATIAPQLWLVAGTLAALAAALLTLQLTVGLDNYFHWTITFARQRRLPGLSVMLGTYHQTSLLWTIPAAIAALTFLHGDRGCHAERSAAESKDLLSLESTNGARRYLAILLLAAPFLWTIATLFFTDDPSDRADQLLSLWPHLLLLSTAFAVWSLRPANLRANPTLNTLLPVILLATIHGTFLSQQLWGSTYALWPLLMLLIAMLLTQIPAIARPIAVVITATFILCGTLYATSHERLSYIHLDGTLARATLPEIHGLSSPGPWIPAFEELVRVTNAEIPASDGVLLIPGENPFFFATGRVPQFPILLFDPATDPSSPQQTRDEARARNIRWLILSRETQLTASPYDALPAITRALLPDFVPYRTLTNYTIYRRKENVLR